MFLEGIVNNPLPSLLDNLISNLLSALIILVVGSLGGFFVAKASEIFSKRRPIRRV